MSFEPLPPPAPRWAPEPDARISGALIRALTRPEREPKTRGYFTPSAAGKCARQIGLKALGAAPDPEQEPDPVAIFSMGMGGVVEDLIVAQLIAELGADRVATQVEVSGTIDTPRGPVTVFGFADIVISDDTGAAVEVWDVKSTGAYGFGMKVAGRTGRTPAPPEGPSDEHVLQTAVYARLLGASRVGIAYVARDALAGYTANTPWMDDAPPERRVVADFAVDADDPGLVEAVDRELARQAGIAGRVKAGMVPKRIVPGCEEIVGWNSRGHGLWTDNDGKQRTEWQCAYCEYRERCEEIGPGAVPFWPQPGDATFTITTTEETN